jgi:hypothetical protein
MATPTSSIQAKVDDMTFVHACPLNIKVPLRLGGCTLSHKCADCREHGEKTPYG